MVVSVGIDVSKDKHDCFILNSEGEILSDVFTIPNSLDGFTILLQRIRDCSSSQDNIKVGLEATGHYSYNILGFLLDNGLPTYVLNPCAQTFTERALVSERRRLTGSMRERLRLCFCPMQASSPTQTQFTTTRS